MKYARILHLTESADFREIATYEDHSRRPESVLEQKSIPNLRAQYAMDFLMHNGINGLVEDGESTNGAQKIRKETVTELVSKAVETSDALFNEFEKRGWLHHTIPFSEKMENFLVARQIEISNGDKEL